MEPVLAIVLSSLVLLALGFFLVYVPSVGTFSVVLIVLGLALMFGLGVHTGRGLNSKDIGGQH
jgi:hypothetical protein